MIVADLNVFYHVSGTHMHSVQMVAVVVEPMLFSPMSLEEEEEGAPAANKASEQALGGTKQRTMTKRAEQVIEFL